MPEYTEEEELDSYGAEAQAQAENDKNEAAQEQAVKELACIICGCCVNIPPAGDYHCMEEEIEITPVEAARRVLVAGYRKIDVEKLTVKRCSGDANGFIALRDFVAQRGAGAGTATESNAYSIVLAKMDELEG